jgi:hypothetical protein
MIYDHLPERSRWLTTSALNGAILLAGIVMLIYTYYAAATADDFCRASYPVNLTWLAHIKQEYMEWSGRWAAHSVYVLTFPKIGITSIGYSLLLLLSGPIWFLIFYAAADSIRECDAWSRESIHSTDPFGRILDIDAWAGGNLVLAHWLDRIPTSVSPDVLLPPYFDGPPK